MPPLPPDALIIVPVRNTVLFPGLVLPITLGRPKSVAAAQQAVRDQRQVGILLQREASVDDPTAIDMHRMGTLANIVRYITTPDGTHHLVCQGEQRFQIVEYLSGWPFLVARVLRIPESETRTSEIEARFVNLKAQAVEAIQLLPQVPADLLAAIQSIETPSALADLATAYMDVKPEEKQEILETIDISARMDKVSRMLGHRIEVLRLSQEIGRQTKASLDERQREVLLREQMAAIQKQLGEGEEGKAAEIAELDKAIANAGMPKEVEDQARKELRRLQRMPEAAGEYGMVRTYLDWLIELPWKLPEEKPIDIEEARRDSRRGSLRPRQDQAAHRRISGGAQARPAGQGHDPVLRRPARRRQDLARPVDRARHGPQVRARQPRRRARRGGNPRPSPHLYRRAARQHHPGDPQGRLAQLRHDARRDRQARRRLPRRSRRGAARSARSRAEQHVPRQLSRGAVRPEPRGLHHHGEHARHHSRAAARPHGDHQPRRLHRRREARNRAPLSAAPPDGGERAQARPGRDRRRGAARHHPAITPAKPACAASSARSARCCATPRCASPKGKAGRSASRATILLDILGAPKFESEMAMRTSVPGVATGLAWTPVGGDILFIEATRIPGSGKLILTGQLGDVMKESAQAALSIVKNRAAALGIDASRFDKSDIHVHVPAGATPKDGPSAGVAMFMALVSLMTERTVRSDTAMTGEISLRGLVLPVGGIKEKVARRACAPASSGSCCRRATGATYDDIPEIARKELEFIWLERVEEAVAAALEPRKADAAPASAPQLADAEA